MSLGQRVPLCACASGWALEADGKAPPTGVPELPSCRTPLSPGPWPHLTNTAASLTTTTIEFSHSNPDTLDSAGSTITNCTGATGVDWAQKLSPFSATLKKLPCGVVG